MTIAYLRRSVHANICHQLYMFSYCMLEYVQKMKLFLKISSIVKACCMLLIRYITEYISKTLKMKYGMFLQ